MRASGVAGQRGQMIVILAFAIVGLLGGVALGADVAVMYFNWQRLQSAADAAALAGANYLPEDPVDAVTAATNYATQNGIRPSELATPVVSNSNQSITVSATRTVQYYFARVLGVTSQDVNASATASAPNGTQCIGCALTANGGSFSGAFGTTVGQYGLVPIGLQYTTNYSYNTAVTLNYNGNGNNVWGPGNWGYLALGGQGGLTLRQNIDYGYSGPLQVNNWVNSQTGLQVGNGANGLQDRINAGLTEYPSATFSNHSPNDPRILFLPLVDWNNPNGTAAVQVMGFAALWLDNVQGGTVSAHFISQVAPDSIPNTSGPYAGTRGAPILVK